MAKQVASSQRHPRRSAAHFRAPDEKTAIEAAAANLRDSGSSQGEMRLSG